MNKIKLLGLSIIVLSLFSCVEKFDYNNMDKDLKFGTSLVIPVGYSTLTASEVLYGMSDSAILVDKDKNIELVLIKRFFQIWPLCSMP